MRIYVDIDGVLNHAGTPAVQHTVAEAMVAGIDPACVDRLRQIVDATGAEIVLSSTWRTMPEAARAVGLAIAPMVVAGSTPLDEFAACDILRVMRPKMSHYPPARGLEIAAHLYLNPCEHYVILDDTAICGRADGLWWPTVRHLMGRHVRTSERHGLRDADVDSAIAILRGDL